MQLLYLWMQALYLYKRSHPKISTLWVAHQAEQRLYWEELIRSATKRGHHGDTQGRDHNYKRPLQKRARRGGGLSLVLRAASTPGTA